jgi:hypothetical protein
MPSRKKEKGKARREAKQAKAKEEKSQAVVAAANQRQEGPLEAQMQRLQINSTAMKCSHGQVILSPDDTKICKDFLTTFITVYNAGVDNVGVKLFGAYTATEEKYPDVYSSKLESVVSILLNNGTQCILEGDNHYAPCFAMFARFFEEYLAVEVHETKATINWAKIYELNGADVHTLVKYYRKRISCSCLDEKYNEVKSVTKMGMCYHPNCGLPNQMVERSKMFYCTRCGDVNYCSIECQKADWEGHRGVCDAVVEWKTAFDSRKQSLR